MERRQSFPRFPVGIPRLVQAQSVVIQPGVGNHYPIRRILCKITCKTFMLLLRTLQKPAKSSTFSRFFSSLFFTAHHQQKFLTTTTDNFYCFLSLWHQHWPLTASRSCTHNTTRPNDKRDDDDEDEDDTMYDFFGAGKIGISRRDHHPGYSNPLPVVAPPETDRIFCPPSDY